MKPNTSSSATRREFVKSSARRRRAHGRCPLPHVANAAAAGDKIKIGWVGCGGRGTGAANQALNADSNLVMWSMGDIFQDKIDSGLESLKKEQAKNPEKVSVAAERQFTGLDAFQKVLNSGVDVVLLTTSPGFRPQHIKAAIEAGKHVFAEKPMAVDGPGVRSVMESIKLAKQKNLALVDGFVWRWTTANRDAFAKIHDGAVGDIKPSTPATTRARWTAIRSGIARTPRPTSSGRFAAGITSPGSPATTSSSRPSTRLTS